MTRAAQRSKIEDIEMEQPEELWEDTHGGETPDSSTAQSLRLAHKAAEKFPELNARYKNFAGTAAVVSGALIVLAGVAVARRVKRGQNAEQILEQITSEEIERAATASTRRNRIWRMIGRIARRRANGEGASE